MRTDGDCTNTSILLTPRAEVLLQSLTAAHLDELRNLAPALTDALGPATR